MYLSLEDKLNSRKNKTINMIKCKNVSKTRKTNTITRIQRQKYSMWKKTTTIMTKAKLVLLNYLAMLLEFITITHSLLISSVNKSIKYFYK